MGEFRKGLGQMIEGATHHVDVLGCLQIENQQRVTGEGIHFTVYFPLPGDTSCETLYSSKESFGHIVCPLNHEVSLLLIIECKAMTE